MEFEENYITLNNLKPNSFFIGKTGGIKVYLTPLGDDKHMLYDTIKDITFTVPHGRFPIFKALPYDFEIINIKEPTFIVDNKTHYVSDKLFDNLFDFQKEIFKAIEYGYNKCYLYDIKFEGGFFFIRYKYIKIK